MSTQSSITTVSEVTSIEEPETHETECIILATTEVERPIKAAKGAKKGGKTKKAPAKSKAKADDSALASSFIEPEDDDFEVKVEKIPKKSGRNKKRGSDEMNGEHDAPPAENDMTKDVEGQPPPAKRRATRSRNSVMQNGDSAHFLQNAHELDANMTDAEMMPPPAAPAGKKGVKKGSKKPSSTVRIASDASIASVASLRSVVPDDDSINAALEEELNRPLTDDEVEIEPEIEQKKPRRLTRTRPALRHATASTAQVRRTTRASTITDGGINSGDQGISMQDAANEPTETASDGEIEDEMTVPVPTTTVIKGNKSRKASSKPQTSTVISAHDKANASVAALRVQPDLPASKPKGPRCRQPSRRLAGRKNRHGAPPTFEDVNITDSNVNSTINVHASEDESGHETDASASTQTLRGKKGFTGMKKKAMKNAESVSRNVKKIVQPGAEDTTPNDEENGANILSVIAANSIEPEVLPVKLTETILDMEVKEVTEALLNTAQPMLDASAITADESEFVDAMSVQSPSQSVSLTENAQSLAGSSEATKSVHESTPPPAETPEETPKQLPSVQTTPRPVFSPQSSDAENQPPSYRPSATRPPLSVKSHINTQTIQIRSIACTPTASPSKQNTLRLQSVLPWMPADVEKLFLGSPGGNEENDPFTMGSVITQDVNDSLTVPEKKLSMEEWIRHKARQAEEKLRNDCERLIGKFEGEGVRALMTLEGISCTD